MTKPTILILVTHTGGGHVNLAQALRDILESRSTVLIVNAHPPISEHWYTLVSRHAMAILTGQFVATDTAFASLWLHRYLALTGSRGIRRIIDDVRPDLIITTHAFLSYTIARANEQRREHVPLVFQLTDLERVHSTWFAEKHADAYLAPTREIFAQAQEQGIKSCRLFLTGRPVRRQFLDASSEKRNETLAALHLDPGICTIFLQGGARGSASVDRLIERLLKANVPVQIILAAGNNKGMAARYARVKQVRVLPFIDIITPYMAAADIIVGKAGASSITEAFTLEKPFLVTAYIPGQETPSLHFIEQHNLGWVCLEPNAQVELLSKIAYSPSILSEKQESIRAYNTWNRQANQGIAPIIDRLLSNETSPLHPWAR